MGNVKMDTRQRRPVMLPLIVALGNHIIKEIGLVERINETVRWDASQWEISPGMQAKAMILATLNERHASAADPCQQPLRRTGHRVFVWQWRDP